VSAARLTLHVAAAVVPLLLVFLAFTVLLHDGMGGIAEIGFTVVAATQAACLAGWTFIERRARAGASGWPAGLGIAALAYLLFAIAMAIPSRKDGMGDAMRQAVKAFEGALVISLVSTGWLGFPITMIVAHRIARIRAQEIRHAIV
jgi:hypothetical protein